jgi:hypothetical protein
MIATLLIELHQLFDLSTRRKAVMPPSACVESAPQMFAILRHRPVHRAIPVTSGIKTVAGTRGINAYYLNRLQNNFPPWK